MFLHVFHFVTFMFEIISTVSLFFHSTTPTPQLPSTPSLLLLLLILLLLLSSLYLQLACPARRLQW